MNRMNKSAYLVAETGLFTAMIILLSQIAIPLPSGVPVTLQTFAISLCGYILGNKKGLRIMLIYILIGVLGVPVFANFKSGVGALFGVTGGFIWGFLILIYLCGLNINIKNATINVSLGLIGLVICHIIGVIQFSIVTSNGFMKSLFIVSMPYLVKDILSVITAYLAAVTIKKRLMKENLIKS